MAAPPTAELLRSLGRLVRGLSTLLWALPLTLVLYVATARLDWLERLRTWAFLPAVVVSVLVWYALRQLRDFQRQERIWQQALNRAEIFAIIDTGLSPFLYWWHRLPSVPLYRICIGFILVSTFLLLIHTNHVLQRLSAMLPDEMLRAESKMFTSFNILVLAASLTLWSLYYSIQQWPPGPLADSVFRSLDTPWGKWAMLLLTLLPLAMTMSLIWKTKEVIFTSLFNAER